MPLLKKISIAGYRLFDALEVAGLERVNLFVGKNNAGKTALLEAIEILCSQASPYHLARGPIERGEVLPPQQDGESRVLPHHWFPGHKLGNRAAIRLKGDMESVDGNPEVKLSLSSQPLSPAATMRIGRLGYAQAHIVLTIHRSLVELDESIGLSYDDAISISLARPAVDFEEFPTPVQFAGTRQLRVAELAEHWTAVQLTPAKQHVLDAMRVVDPTIEDLAFQVWLQQTPAYTEAQVRLRGSDQPIPLGSLGEGVTRALSLSLHLARARGGVLLIDEIDTGLHHSTLIPIWRLIIETAQALDVQVFATSHSWDCISALGFLFEREPELGKAFALHRLEAGRKQTTRYAADEISAAAEHKIEVR